MVDKADVGPAPNWVCFLADHELNAWQQGDWDTQARSLGIGGWIVPLTVQGTGESQGPLQPGEGWLPAAPLLRLEGLLTPMEEQRLARQLRSWFRHSQALRLWGQPLLVLQGAEQLSHPQFSLKFQTTVWIFRQAESHLSSKQTCL